MAFFIWLAGFYGVCWLLANLGQILNWLFEFKLVRALFAGVVCVLLLSPLWFFIGCLVFARPAVPAHLKAGYQGLSPEAHRIMDDFLSTHPAKH